MSIKTIILFSPTLLVYTAMLFVVKLIPIVLWIEQRTQKRGLSNYWVDQCADKYAPPSKYRDCCIGFVCTEKIENNHCVLAHEVFP